MKKKDVPCATERRSGRDRKTTPSQRRKYYFPPNQFVGQAGADLPDFAFLLGKAVERYKRVHRRPFPTFSEVAELIVAESELALAMTREAVKRGTISAKQLAEIEAA